MTTSAQPLNGGGPHQDPLFIWSPGGYPCQPVSLAGNGRGDTDERWLWPAMADVIRDLRPPWVLVENVPGLLGRGMGTVVGDLAAIGYDTEWDCIPAAVVGAPHRRDRVFILAHTDLQATQREARGGGATVATTSAQQLVGR